MREIQVITKNGRKSTISTVHVEERKHHHRSAPISCGSPKMDIEINIDKNMSTEEFFALCRKMLKQIEI